MDVVVLVLLLEYGGGGGEGSALGSLWVNSRILFLFLLKKDASCRLAAALLLGAAFLGARASVGFHQACNEYSYLIESCST